MKLNKIISIAILAASVLTGCTSTMLTEKFKGRVDVPVVVQDYKMFTNSVGGVKFEMWIWSNSPKTIKYLHSEIEHFDRVGEKVFNEIGGNSIQRYKLTGPYQYGSNMSSQYQIGFYNHAVHCVVLNELKVVYMDGTEIVLRDDALDKVLNFDGKKCRSTWN